MKSMPPKSKLPNTGQTIFTTMSALAQQHQALNLSQGFPNFQPDPQLFDLVSFYMKNGNNQYAPMAGILELRQQISDLVDECYAASYDPESEITITSGATEAIYCAITTLVHEGDEVILLEPAYDSYLPAIELSGGIPVTLALEPPDFRINWAHLKKLINLRTRAIILNSPHNPTGAILHPEDLETLEQLIAPHPIYLISDEVYEHIIFDGHPHQSLARYPGLRSRSLIISSFGKTLHATGWKIGYCLAPKELTWEFRKIHQYLTFSTSTPFQYAIADYLQNFRESIFQLGAFYQEKRDLFLNMMKPTRFKALPCLGTYFQLMNYQEISSLPDDEFAQWLTREYGVACIPVSAFYRRPIQSHLVRFCFAKDVDTLTQAAERLQKL